MPGFCIFEKIENYLTEITLASG